MRTAKEIAKEIRDLRREMRATKVRISSCFNGGHTPDSYRLNARLFALGVELSDARKREATANGGK